MVDSYFSISLIMAEQGESKRIELSPFKNVTVKLFNGTPYYHFWDNAKGNRVSLNDSEMKALKNCMPQLSKARKQLLMRGGQCQQQQQQKRKTAPTPPVEQDSQFIPDDDFDDFQFDDDAW